MVAWPHAKDADALPSRAFLGKIGTVKRFDAITGKWKVELETAVPEARKAIDEATQGQPGVAYVAHQLKMSLGFGPKAVVWLADEQVCKKT